MSWSLLLLKQVPKNWTTQLPADDPIQWAQLIRFHSLTQDKEGNKNIPLDNDAFINDIKSGSYPQKGIRGTIKQLEEWKENPNAWDTTVIGSLASGRNPVTRPKHIRTIIGRFVKEVLPILEKNYKGGKREAGAKTQFKRKTDWNNTESAIKALTGITELSKEEQLKLLEEFNSNLRDKVKVNDKLQSFGLKLKPNIRTILSNVGLLNQITITISNQGMSDEEWSRVRLDSIGDVTFKRDGTSIFSSRLEKEKLGDIREKIMERLKTRNIKIKPEQLPVVRAFGVGKLITAQTEEDYKTTPKKEGTRLSQAELLQQQEKEFEKYKVNPNFTFDHAQYYYGYIVRKGAKFVPERLKGSQLITGTSGTKSPKGANPIVLQLLDDEYSDTSTLYSDFMTNTTQQLYKNRNAVMNYYIERIIESGGKDFKSLFGKDVGRLSDIELSEFQSKNDKEKRLYLKQQFTNPDSSLYPFLNKMVDDDRKVTPYLSLSLSDVELKFVEKLKDYDKTIEKIEEETTDEGGVEDFQILRPLFVNPVKETSGIKHFTTKGNRDRLDEFIANIKVLDTIQQVRDRFGDTYARMINSLRKKAKPKVTIMPQIQSVMKERTEGLNPKERDVALVVFSALDNKKDFKDVLRFQSSSASAPSFGELFAILTKLGRAFTTQLGVNNYTEFIDDLKYDKENPKSDAEVKSIVKDLVAAVEQDIPKVRNFLKEEAEKKVKEILENPAKHLDKETRRKALAGKTKGKTSIINLLVRQKIIVEDK
tara:strand:- start:2728 stop:5013 length:2286 start_codon:yes stop_codon:yes gene_type:complete